MHLPSLAYSNREKPFLAPKPAPPIAHPYYEKARNVFQQRARLATSHPVVAPDVGIDNGDDYIRHVRLREHGEALFARSMGTYEHSDFPLRPFGLKGLPDVPPGLALVARTPVR
jgi:hypothetical protein